MIAALNTSRKGFKSIFCRILNFSSIHTQAIVFFCPPRPRSLVSLINWSNNRPNYTRKMSAPAWTFSRTPSVEEFHFLIERLTIWSPVKGVLCFVGTALQEAELWLWIIEIEGKRGIRIYKKNTWHLWCLLLSHYLRGQNKKEGVLPNALIMLLSL